MLAINTFYEFVIHFKFGWYVYDILKLFVLSSLGIWCIRGGYKNLLQENRSSGQQGTSEPQSPLAKWHLLALTSIGLIYLLMGLSYWKFDFPSIEIIKGIHYVFVGLFALIPITVIIYFAKKI